MNIVVNKCDEYIELELNGRLDVNTSQKLSKILSENIEKGEDNILINFAELNYISSSGLRVLLAAAKKLDAKNKKLNFCHMTDYIKEVFEIAGFNSIFNFYNTKEEFPR